MGDFGRAYTDRNSLTLPQLDALYECNYGVTRRELNQRFLAELPRDTRILEVGCNIGNQLRLLWEMGYRNLCGIELQHYAVRRALLNVPGGHFLQASALEIPFADGSFDLVFTSGVLIHISPTDLTRALDEIHRCAREYIWGFEYHSSEPTEVEYRGQRNLLWKMNYAEMFCKRFDDLDLVHREHCEYLENSNVDCMFLLRKKVRRVPAVAGGA
jgi:pseudaminic acid biosynthesis-associated methylase